MYGQSRRVSSGVLFLRGREDMGLGKPARQEMTRLSSPSPEREAYPRADPLTVGLSTWSLSFSEFPPWHVLEGQFRLLASST